MEKVTQRNLPDFPVGRFSIEPNLFLIVKKNGYRGFSFRVRLEGKDYEKSLGSARKVSLAYAKAEAQRIRGEIAKGLNPFIATSSEKVVPTLRECAKAVIDVQEQTKQWRNDRSRTAWENTLAQHVFPMLGDKPVNEITLDDVYDVLRPLWFEKTETASRIRGLLEKIFDYASFRGHIATANPARWRGGLENLLPSPSKVKTVEHHEALTLEEAQLCARKFVSSSYVSHQAILFGMLTCSRLSEFLLARWTEIDLDNAVWVCPANRAKTGISYRFPLSKQALELLRGIEQTSESLNRKNNRTPRYVSKWSWVG